MKKTVLTVLSIILAVFVLLGMVGLVSAKNEGICPSDNGWTKVEPLSGFTYTFTPPTGYKVTENCYKHSTYLHFGSGPTVTADKHDCVWDRKNWEWDCKQYELSHASFKVVELPTPIPPTATPIPPTATPTNTPVVMCEWNDQIPADDIECVEPTATPVPPTPTPVPTEVCKWNEQLPADSEDCKEPTATPVPPTETPVPTDIPPTETLIPDTETPQPTATGTPKKKHVVPTENPCIECRPHQAEGPVPGYTGFIMYYNAGLTDAKVNNPAGFKAYMVTTENLDGFTAMDGGYYVKDTTSTDARTYQNIAPQDWYSFSVCSCEMGLWFSSSGSLAKRPCLISDDVTSYLMRGGMSYTDAKVWVDDWYSMGVKALP